MNHPSANVERGFSVRDNANQRVQRRMITSPSQNGVRQNYHSQERQAYAYRQNSASPNTRFVVYGDPSTFNMPHQQPQQGQYIVRGVSPTNHVQPNFVQQPQTQNKVYYSVASAPHSLHALEIESANLKQLLASKDHEIESLRSIQKELPLKEAEIKNLENRIMILLNENSSLNSVLNSKIEELNSLMSSNQNSNSEQTDLHQKLREAENTILHLSNEISLFQGNSHHLEKAREKLISLEKDLLESKSISSSLSTENEELRKELTKLVQNPPKSNKSEDKLLSLQAEMEKAFGEIEFWKGKSVSQEEEVRMLASEVSYLRGKNDNAEKDIERLEGIALEAEAMKPKSLELLALIVSLATEIEALRDSNLSLENQLFAANSNKQPIIVPQQKIVYSAQPLISTVHPQARVSPKRRRSSEIVKMKAEGVYSRGRQSVRGSSREDYFTYY